MEIFTYERPAALSAVRAPQSAVRAPQSAVRVAPATARPSVSQVHQVQVQAELTLTVAPNGIEGASGFTGMGVGAAKKRTDIRGVPPRGRPV